MTWSPIIGAYARSLPATLERSPISELSSFLDECAPAFACLHLLPPFVSCGDDGFAVVDHLGIDPVLGTWRDIQDASRSRPMLLDAILNHTGRESSLGRLALETPWEVLHEVYAYTEQDVGECVPLSPRGGSVFRHWIRDELGIRWTVWQTFGEDEIDVRLDSPAQMKMRRSLFAKFVQHGVSMVRLDAAAYYAKVMGEPNFHHPLSPKLAEKVAKEAVEAGLKVMFQLDSDDRGLRYVQGDVTRGMAVVDYAFTVFLIHAQLRGRSGPLIDYLESTHAAAHDWLRAPRNHDGILLRPARVTEHVRSDLLSCLGNYGVRPRVSNGTPYEINESYPFLMSFGSNSKHEADRRITAGLAITLLVSGIPYLYLPATLGSVPERYWNRSSDPRALNRRPIHQQELSNMRTSGILAQRRALILHLWEHRRRHGPLKPERGYPAHLLVLSSEDEMMHCFVNLSSTRSALPTVVSGVVLYADGWHENLLSPYGWAIVTHG